MNDNIFLEKAKEYLNKGYSPIPVARPKQGDKKSGKRPAVADWPNFRLTINSLPKYWGDISKPCNIGIPMGVPSGLAGLDFDLPEPFFVLKEAFPEDVAKSFIVARDNAEEGRCHIYFKVEGDEFPKTTNRPKDGWELKSTGAQLVAPPSVHYTGGKYRVIQDNPPLPWDNKYLDCLLEYSKEKRPKKEVKLKTLSARKGERDLVLEALKHIDSKRFDDYDSWLRIGFIMHNSGCSWEEWDTASKVSDNYEEGKCQEKWGSFDRDDDRAKLTYKTLVMWAGEDTGWEPDLRHYFSASNGENGGRKSVIDEIMAEFFLAKSNEKGIFMIRYQKGEYYEYK